MKKINDHSNILTKRLESELSLRISKNARYSLRAFAKHLDISPSYLSRVLSGKRTLALDKAISICNRLDLDPKSRRELLSEIAQTDEVESSKKLLEIDMFNAISEWYHFGITQLINLKEFRYEPRWMASMLGISELEVKLAIDRLLRLNILKETKKSLKRAASTFETTTDIYSSGLRIFHKQILEKAIESLDFDPINERDITSITMAIDEKNIPRAKSEIKKFRNKISKLLEDGVPTRVYNLGVHLIPLSEKAPRGDEHEH